MTSIMVGLLVSRSSSQLGPPSKCGNRTDVCARIPICCIYKSDLGEKQLRRNRPCPSFIFEEHTCSITRKEKRGSGMAASRETLSRIMEMVEHHWDNRSFPRRIRQVSEKASL